MYLIISSPLSKSELLTKRIDNLDNNFNMNVKILSICVNMTY